MDTLANRFDAVINRPDSALSEILRSRWAESTIDSYRRDWLRFCDWSVLNDCVSYPVTPSKLVDFLVWLHKHSYSKSLIRRTITVIRLLHETNDDPTTDRTVQEVMRGIARKDRREPAKAHPLSITDLTAICNELFRLYMNKSSCEYWRLTRDIALITIGWCGALRASELVALNWNDIVEVQQGIEITVRQSKTSLDAEIIALPLLRDDYRFICPVRAMRLWKRSCMDINLSIPGIDIHTRTGIPADGAQPVFVNCFGKRLNKRSVSRILESASAKSNLNLHLSAHSLRRGFATFAAFAGITDRSLMRHGRWKTSSIMQGYIEHAKIWTDNPVVQLLT